MGNITKKFAAVVLSTTTAAWISGFALLVPIAHAQSVSDLQSQINALLSQIAALQAQLAAQGGAPSASCTFTRDLTVGSRGDDVKCLQAYLKVSPQSGFFGPLTKAAVAKWQAANGVSPASGFFGPKSRAKYAALAAAPAPAPAPSPAPAPAGAGGLTVTLAPDQPDGAQAKLFPKSVASRAMTKLLFSASSSGDITVNSLTVERQGPGADAAFAGVVALDENGVRMSDSKTFGSDHRLKLTNSFVVKAGQTRTITLAGDAASDESSYNGQLVGLALVAVDSSAASTNAALPLVNSSYFTVNNTLSVGAATLDRGSLDPGASNSKEIGTVGYIFSSLKVTAGSNEDVLLKSIRWNQAGSAAPSDLANIKTYVDGTPYDTAVSSDGKYFTTVFGSGIKILKGLNKEIYIKGDITNGSARTVSFDLYRYADLKVTGTTYGYDLLPSATEVAASADDGNFHSAQPNFDAFKATIGSGSIQVQNAPTVGAQNIAINLADQPLGGFIVDVKGEDVTVGAMNFDSSAVKSNTTSRALDTNDITNITLSDENGKVVAGPVDGVAGGKNGARFTDTVTFKVGRHIYTLKGKLNTDFQSNDTVTASTTPSSQWSTVKGVTSGVTITPSPTSAVTGSTMTVKAASMAVTLTPDTQVTSNASTTAQNVVAGTSNYTFTKYVLDASGSGEDVKTTSMSLRVRISSVNDADDMTNCQLWDGSTALNTGTNVVNPSNSDANGDTKVFTFDTALTIPKGTIKTLSLKCNLISGADSGQQYGWGITDAAASVVSTGAISGQSITESITADNGRVITALTSGTLAVALDTGSNPASRWLQAGTTDNAVTVLRLTSSNEDVRVDMLGLQIATSTTNDQDGTTGNASNTPSDYSKVTIWDGATKVGEAVFTSSDYATATLSGVTIPKDNQKLLTVKVDTASIGIGLPARPGHTIVVNYDAQASTDKTNTGAVGVGLSSGVTIAAGGSDTAANDMRLARAYPTISKLAHPSGKFANTGSQTLYRFKATAPAGTNGVGLYKMTFEVSTSTTQGCDNSGAHTCNFNVTSFKLYCYSDSSFSVPSCGSFDNSGLLNQGGLANASVDKLSSANPTVISIYFNPTDSAQGSTKQAIQIPAGDTRYFALLADVANASSTPNITTKMDGDAQFDSLNNSAGGGYSTAGTGNDLTQAGDNYLTGRYIFATTASNADAWDDNDFIWSGESTNTTQSVNDYDWFNGFLVPGLSNSDTGVTETVTLQ